MSPKSATLPFVFITWLAALPVGGPPREDSLAGAGLQGTTLAGAPGVPALEPSFTVQDVAELLAARPPARGPAPTRAAESDADHVARLMAGRLRCADAHDNDVGGRNAECLAVR